MYIPIIVYHYHFYLGSQYYYYLCPFICEGLAISLPEAKLNAEHLMTLAPPSFTLPSADTEGTGKSCNKNGSADLIVSMAMQQEPIDWRYLPYIYIYTYIYI